jgi:carboxymethylenebutenolidase
LSIHGRSYPEELSMDESPAGKTGLTLEQQPLNDLWEEHIRDEFATRDTKATIDTMVPDACVNHVPVLTGGVGREQLREFYSRHFIPKMPQDTEIVPISRTIAAERLVDEMIFRFTHTLKMDWMLPGIARTGKSVECGLVVIVHFRDGKLSRVHLYWDQASVLVQLGLLDSARLPVAGTGVRKETRRPQPAFQSADRMRLWRRRLVVVWKDGQRHSGCGRGIIAQLDIQTGSVGTRNRQGISHITRRHRNGALENRIGCHGTEQEKIGADERAFFFRGVRAANFL